MNMIETHNLTKAYGDFKAVSKLNLHVKKGTVYGFLGPNGAGKSTTMKMFLGLTAPTRGSFTINGMSYPKDRREILRQTGSFIESPAFYGNLSGEENLDLIRRILRLPRSAVEDALELVGLTEHKKRLAKKYSLGMKQRLGLARVLASQAQLLLMDEPFASLDFLTRGELQSQLLAIQKKLPRTIVLVTHQLEEALLLGQKIVVMHPDSTIREFDLSALPYPRDVEQPVLRALKAEITDECRKPTASE